MLEFRNHRFLITLRHVGFALSSRWAQWALACLCITYLSGGAVGWLHDSNRLGNEIKAHFPSQYLDDWTSFYADLSPCVESSGLIDFSWDHSDWTMPPFVSGPPTLVAEVRFGLPFRSHSYTLVRSADGTSSVITPSALRFHGRAIPTDVNAVLWLANTMTFMLVYLLLWVAVQHCLMSHRMRLGRCAFCKYDLREIDVAICPECGALR